MVRRRRHARRPRSTRHNPGPNGARALAQVLGDEGVDVEVARSIADLEDVEPGDDLTVVVTSTQYLGRGVIDRMRDHLGNARVVVVEPGEGVLAALRLRLPLAAARARRRRRWAADCDDQLMDGLTLEVDRSQVFDIPGCFTDADRSVLVERGNTTLFGAGEALTNDQVVRGDNAAVTLRLLGQTERLLWYVPSYDDLSAGDGVSAETLLPRWIRPGLWLAAIIGLVVIAWRVRRLGPLAVEPLPVVVKAIETTRSRGRLYRKAGDRATCRRTAPGGCARPALPSGSGSEPAHGRGSAGPRRRAARGPARGRDRRDPRQSRAGARLRPRPDIPGQGPGRTRGRGTPQMTETPSTPPTALGTDESARERLAGVRTEVAKAVVGQDAAVSGLLVALLCGGHVLMEGVPGTAKTLLVRTLAASLSVETTRVQFTPDLMPGDITGSMVIDSTQGELRFREGPVFTNLLLADEINRTPPKTQSALLEAMEEGQVSVDGVSRQLPQPFLVAATQNPVEYEGTYPLPEAQLDRFLLKVILPIPDRPSEMEILRRHAAGFDPRDVAGAGVSAVAGAADIEAGQRAVKTVQVSPEVAGYIVDIARATRESPSLSLGVSPRGATSLLRAARAWAWLNGRDFVTPDDVKALAHASLVHRLGLRPEAELEGVDVSQVLSSALGSVPVPR